MRFGLQKLTLLDYPGVMACTVFTNGCNFRCPFCHNASIVTGKESDMPLDADGLLTFLDSRKKILDGVCITGGEPLLHDEIPGIISEIKKLGYKVKLDTNGSRPEHLKKYLTQGLWIMWQWISNILRKNMRLQAVVIRLLNRSKKAWSC